MRQRSVARTACILAVACALCTGARLTCAQDTPRFVGDSRCGNPTCHGAGLPANETQKKSWKPWKSARTQWLNRNIDRHSRAYATLETNDAKTIASYMGIEATSSDKCLSCHAPAAQVAPDTAYRRSDGVTCEHCHGAAEQWLKAHVEKDWPEKKAQAAGFYDNRNAQRRAEKCAACHIEIDHEIVAGGHPPLQFEMVAYGQVIKHWDDQAKLAPGSFSPDPLLWGVGQIVGLRRTAQMIAGRAGDANYQGLKKFSHFEDRNCYQCHHKLIEDALRQAQGHYEMVDALFASRFPDRRDELGHLWNDLAAGVHSSGEQAQQHAARLEQWLASYEQDLVEHGVDRATAKQWLERITASGERFKSIKRFSYNRPPTANITRLDNIGEPWWYTTGAPEQTILAIEALCAPVFADKCGAGAGGIETDLRKLLSAVDRFDYHPEQFSSALGAINRKLFH